MEAEQIKKYRLNAEEDYLHTPISVLRYISELEAEVAPKQEQEELFCSVKGGYCPMEIKQTRKCIADFTCLNKITKGQL